MAGDRAARSPGRAPLALVLAAAAAAVALSVFPVHNDDLGFHVATGRFVRATGTVPDHNPFTYAADGATWVQHQWIPAVFLSWVVDAGGAPAVVFVKAALVALAFAALGLGLRRLRTPAGAAALLLAVTLAAAANRFYERPYLFSLLALTVVTAALLAWRADGCRRSPLPWVAAATTVAAVHLHAGGLDGLLVWGALAAGVLVERWLPARDVPPAPAGRVLVFAAGTALAVVASLALLAPAGLRVLTLPFSFATNAYWNQHLVEFRPLPLSARFVLGWLAVAVAAAAAVLAVLRRRVPELLLALGFGWLGLTHLRMVWPMAVAATLALGALLGAAPWRARLTRGPVTAALGAVALAVLVWGAVEQGRRFPLWRLGADGIDHRHHPLALLERARDLPPEALVSDGLAGTWLWWNFRGPETEGGLPPAAERRRVLVHNCLECYREETYIDVYQAIRYAAPGWREKVAALGVRTFLLKYTSPGERRFQQGRPNLRQELFADDAFRLVDFDDVATLYVAADAAPPEVAARPPFPVDPDTGRPRAGATYDDAREALRAHAAAHPDGTRALLLLAHVARLAGDDATRALALRELLARDPDNAAALEQAAELRAAQPR
jgi:hypothetical protein